MMYRTDAPPDTLTACDSQVDAPATRHACRRIARHAVLSLYRELTLFPKPGLVSRVDSGSHADMNGATLWRSLFALRHYFFAIARAGAEGADFARLRRLGMDAEQTMLRATGGVNTHRGAIFCIGLLCAAAGACVARGQPRGQPLRPASLRAMLLREWGAALGDHARDHARATDGDSHGLRVARLHAVGGARAEAARGFASLFEVGVPALRAALCAGYDADTALSACMFALMARVHDSNLYHRGGSAGATYARNCARDFLDRGGVTRPGWRADVLALHTSFVARRLSPGGTADLMAASWFVHALDGVAVSLAPTR